MNIPPDALVRVVETPLAMCEVLDVATPDDATRASAAIRWLKGEHKILKDARTYLLEPIDEQRRRVTELLDPAIDRFDRAMRALKKKILAHTESARLQNALAMSLTSTAVQSGAVLVATPTFTPTNPPPGIELRKRWNFEVTDLHALYTHKPGHYVAASESAIGEEMRRQVKEGLTPELPGVRFFQVETVASVDR